MKDKLIDLIDLADIFSKTIRWMFFLVLGIFLAMKSYYVISSWPDNHWMIIPAVLVSLAGGWLMAYPIADEPTPKERREAAAQAERMKQWLKEMDEQINDVT